MMIIKNKLRIPLCFLLAATLCLSACSSNQEANDDPSLTLDFDWGFEYFPHSAEALLPFCNEIPDIIYPDYTIPSDIRDVIQNKKKFFCTENGQSMYLSDFHSDNYLFFNDEGYSEYDNDRDIIDRYYIFTRFCVVDMDGDGINEVLLESSMSNRLLFHYEDGIVYEYSFCFRGMKRIKTDASFEGSGSAGYIVIGRISFHKDRCHYTEICLYDGESNRFRIYGKDVTEEEVREYLKRRDNKEEVEWHVFNKRNLETLVCIEIK
jgi:hypothetical protein